MEMEKALQNERNATASRRSLLHHNIVRSGELQSECIAAAADTSVASALQLEVVVRRDLPVKIHIIECEVDPRVIPVQAVYFYHTAVCGRVAFRIYKEVFCL